jgi:exodeoxyribonuclease VII large subunit
MEVEYKRHIYSVGEITRYIRQLLEEEFPLIWVKGEITNISRPSSGHIYFFLKDKE